MSKAFLLLFAGILTGAGVFYWQATRSLPMETASCGGAYREPTYACDAAACDTATPVALQRPIATADEVSVRLGEGDLLAGVPGDGPLTAEAVRDWLADERNHRPLRPVLPVGLDAGAPDIRGLEENPLTRAKIELGRQLFFDARLSKDGSVSCASCHDPEHGFASPDRFGIGVEGQAGQRNSPTAANRLLSDAQFWDGRAASLEQQAVAPMANPLEMGSTHEAVVDAVGQIEAYRLQFERTFSDGVSIENAGRAIAAFERALVSGASPWDHEARLRAFEALNADDLSDLEWLAKEDPELLDEHRRLQASASATPMTESARRGALIFFSERGGCAQCHVGANFTDERPHNLGVGMTALAGDDVPPESAAVDWGRFTITGDEADRGAFKTPSLRNVAQTAPYMHDGSLATLADVVAWYVEGGGENPWLSPLVEPLELDDGEQTDLIAFLEALTGPWPEVETGRLPE